MFTPTVTNQQLLQTENLSDRISDCRSPSVQLSVSLSSARGSCFTKVEKRKIPSSLTKKKTKKQPNKQITCIQRQGGGVCKFLKNSKEQFVMEKWQMGEEKGAGLC